MTRTCSIEERIETRFVDPDASTNSAYVIFYRQIADQVVKLTFLVPSSHYEMRVCHFTRKYLIY